MNLYQLKSRKFQAVQATPGSLKKAAAAITCASGLAVEVVTSVLGEEWLWVNGYGSVEPGQWVIIDEDNEVRTADPDEFEKLFEPVP